VCGGPTVAHAQGLARCERGCVAFANTAHVQLLTRCERCLTVGHKWRMRHIRVSHGVWCRAHCGYCAAGRAAKADGDRRVYPARPERISQLSKSWTTLPETERFCHPARGEALGAVNGHRPLSRHRECQTRISSPCGYPGEACWFSAETPADVRSRVRP
jgi:hypothetical protein